MKAGEGGGERKERDRWQARPVHRWADHRVGGVRPIKPATSLTEQLATVRPVERDLVGVLAVLLFKRCLYLWRLKARRRPMKMAVINCVGFFFSFRRRFSARSALASKYSYLSCRWSASWSSFLSTTPVGWLGGMVMVKDEDEDEDEVGGEVEDADEDVDEDDGKQVFEVCWCVVSVL